MNNPTEDRLTQISTELELIRLRLKSLLTESESWLDVDVEQPLGPYAMASHNRYLGRVSAFLENATWQVSCARIAIDCTLLGKSGLAGAKPESSTDDA